MKFNPKEPHGTVIGHDCAAFEQNGVLFGGNGLPIDDEPAPIKRTDTLPIDNTGLTMDDTDAAAALVNEAQIETAKTFIENLLAGGPITEAVVRTVSGNNNQRWDTVKAAFELMHGKKSKKGNSVIWALPKVAA